jgi:hypothetical protein
MSNLPKNMEDLFQNYIDVPDWEKSADDPAPALAHQMLISIAAVMGLRQVLEDRVEEVLGMHDDIKDIIADLSVLRDEITGDLQHALHGHELGKQCREHEMEWPVTLEVLRRKEEG